MNRPEAEQIADAITAIRRDWLRTSLLTILGRHQHRSARDVHLALVWIAYDPDTKTPGRIDADGPWWGITRTAGVPAASADPKCPRHGQWLPCLACHAEQVTPATPEQIRARREQARTEEDR